MRKTTILSGKFTSGDNAKGNFTGYNAAGERIFIHKSQMEAAGMKDDKVIAFPFFALVGEKDIQTRDENGELTNVLVKRLQALSVFKSAEELISASNSDAILDIDSKVALAKAATSAGLTESAVNALVNASI